MSFPPSLPRTLGRLVVLLGLMASHAHLQAAEDDFPALFLSQPATNFHSSFKIDDWKFDDRENRERQALTAPSRFRIYHLHMNHHASHLNSDADTGAQFLNFHKTLIGSYNAWRMERGLDAVLSYVACNPAPHGHVELNNGATRQPGTPVGAPCAPLPTSFRIPPLGTLGQAGANPPLNSYNAVGHAVNLTWHSGPHFALGYANLLEDGRNGDMGSTDKSPLDPVFWMWHAAVADVADVWLRTQPADIVVALDRSGSMSLPVSRSSSTTRLAASQEALLFLGRLLPQVVPGGDGRPHRLGLVTFADTVTTQLNLTPITGTGFQVAWSNALHSLPASGPTVAGPALDAARAMVQAGTNENRAILLLSDGANDASLCRSCGTNCQCSGYCTCGSHDHGDGHGPSVPVHTIAIGPAWYETGAELNRTALMQGGVAWSADEDAFGSKQRIIDFVAQTLEAGVAARTNASLAAGSTRSDLFTVPMAGNTAVTFVLLWDRPVNPGNLSLELTSPAGTVLNLSNPAISSTVGSTFHCVRIGIAPAGGFDGNWGVRVVRRAGPGAAEDQRIHLAALGNGPGRVEPAPGSPYAYTGEPLRITFRIRESYWPSNGVAGVEASAIVTGPATSSGEAASALALPPDSTVLGDPRSGLHAALDGIATSLAARTSSSIPLSDAGPGVDGTGADLFAGDHYFTAWYVPQHAGDHQVRAQFRITLGAQTFVREAHHSFRALTRFSSATTLSRSTTLTNDSGELSTTFTFTPRDIFGRRVGPGMASSLRLQPARPGVSIGTVTDLGSGTYAATTTTLLDPSPDLLGRQPGRHPVLLGTNRVPAFLAPIETYAYKPDETVLMWKTAVPATALVEVGERIGEWSMTYTSPLATDHRLALTGLRGGRQYYLRITCAAESGSTSTSEPIAILTPPPSITKITVDRLGYNDPVSNRISGWIHLTEPLESPRVVALSTAQTFNTDNPFTNAVATVTIPAGVVDVPWSLLAGTVDREVELHASVLLGDFPPHVILKLLPPSTQVLTSTDPAGPFANNTEVRIDPYRRLLDVPPPGNAPLFLKLLSPTATTLRVEGLATEHLRIRY